MKIGILGRATNSATATRIAQMKEAFEMAVDECQGAYLEEMVTNGVGNNNAVGSGHLSTNSLKVALEAQGYTLDKAATNFDGTEELQIKKIGNQDYLSVKVKLTNKFTVSLSYGSDLNTEAANVTE